MLLSKYNPHYYQRLFKEMEDEIEEMYHLSTSTVTDSDIGELMIMSYSVEDIAIMIVERKETLEKLKSSATKHCINLQIALTRVPGKYQVALHAAQSKMNIQAINKNQLNAICKALWAVVDNEGDNIPADREDSQMMQAI